MLRNGSKRATAPLLLFLFLFLGCWGDEKDPPIDESAEGQEGGSERTQTYQSLPDPATFPLAAHLDEKYKEDLSGQQNKFLRFGQPAPWLRILPPA